MKNIRTIDLLGLLDLHDQIRIENLNNDLIYSGEVGLIPFQIFGNSTVKSYAVINGLQILEIYYH